MTGASCAVRVPWGFRVDPCMGVPRDFRATAVWGSLAHRTTPSLPLCQRGARSQRYATRECCHFRPRNWRIVFVRKWIVNQREKWRVGAKRCMCADLEMHGYNPVNISAPTSPTSSSVPADFVSIKSPPPPQFRWAPAGPRRRAVYRNTSLIRDRRPPGPHMYSRTIRAWGPMGVLGGWVFPY